MSDAAPTDAPSGAPPAAPVPSERPAPSRRGALVRPPRSVMLEKLRAQLGVLVVQLFFIAAGVYLGMQADEWRQAREHRAAARATLLDFRTELLANRERLRTVAPIYARYVDSIRVSRERGDAPPRTVREVFRRLGWQGLAPIRFQRTAWELALATQALDHVPRPVAFRVARLYDGQEQLSEFQREASAALFSPLAFDDARVVQWLMTFSAYATDSQQMVGQIDRGMGRILVTLDSTIATLPR